MGYGDLQFFDIILFAGIALFLVFRLRKVLGRRTGSEKNISEGFDSLRNTKEKQKINKNVPELEDRFSELKLAYQKIESFNHISFLEGAKIAFETIINAFNNGDKKTLKKLLNDEIYAIFKKAIDEKKNDPESQLFSLNIEKVEKVSIDQGLVIIKIKFISEQFKNNDESTITKKEDAWAFEKEIRSKNPNWKLSST